MNTLHRLVGKAVKAIDGHAYIAARRRVIDTWDFTILKQWMVENNVYPADKVDEAEVEYKRFLTLNLLCPNTVLPVSNEVDPFWHSHLVFTEDYTRMSEQVFGSYFHHRPGILSSQRALDGAFQSVTMPMYRKVFGSLNEKYWGSACCSYGCGGITPDPV